MSRKILGIDIRSDSVSAVLLDSSLKGSCIEALEYVPIEETDDVGEGISLALGQIVENIDIAGVSCIASFSAENVSFRNIKVPFKEPKRIRKVLPFEIESTLPFLVDDLVIDFQALNLPDHINGHIKGIDGTESDESSGGEELTDLITASVEKSTLKSYLDILESYTLNPESVTVGGYSTAMCMASIPELPENWVLVDIDKRKSTLVAACYGQIFLLRSFPSKLDTSSGIEAFCKRVQQTVLSSQEGLPLEFSPESVFVTGELPSGFDIEEKISKILDLPVKQLDLTQAKNIQVIDTGFQPERMNSAFALAVNEAEGLNCFNFRQGEFAARKQWMEHKASFIKTGIIASVILLLALFNVFFDSYSIGKRMEAIEMQKKEAFLSVFPKAKGVKGPLQLSHMKTKLAEEKKGSTFLSDRRKNIRVIDELYDISNFIPKEIDVKFIRLAIRPEDIIISGNTDTNSSVDAIKSGLEQSKNFNKITISSASKDKKTNRIRFKLKVEL